MIEVIFEDKFLLAVNKPANLLSVPGKSNQENLFELLLKDYPNLRLIHRLDMATSGLIVFALTYEAQKNLNKMFEERRVKKRYSAIVEGPDAPSLGEIEIPLICDWPNRPRQMVDWQNGKPAKTAFNKVSTSQNYSLIHLFPITGRSHQLRVHCQAIGHPIVGDRFYAPPVCTYKSREIYIKENFPAVHKNRMYLHAEQLDILHPISEEKIRFLSPAPFSL